MIRLGEIQTLFVIRKSSIGLYLGSKEDNFEEEVLLPNNQVPPGTEETDEIKVFIYRDSEDRMIATCITPKIVVGQVASLKVKEVSSIGAFLDWGLPKDLLLPFKEQTVEVVEGQQYIVGLYVDKSLRLCATMRIYDFLRTDSNYEKNDRVRGIIYDINYNLGALIAVDHTFNGLIPITELHGDYRVGDYIEARVARIRDDGKLDLSLKEEAYIQMDTDAEFILERLKQGGGVLPLNDKSSPEQINEQLNMSKGAFKKAVGRLLKERKIKFTPDGIELLFKP
ncbi:MAG: S1-like domain-containing RNA-binding protein [Bacillota bacterium]|nr:S1-like domain-containing RNA-binding protein [Bacillota bacterium]